MALPTLSLLLGVAALLYFSTFLFFALLRVLTGVSIHWLSPSGLRHIAYTPRDGLKLEVRGLGFKIHRPTFAQPTWLSLVITELKVTLDLPALAASNSSSKGAFDCPNNAPDVSEKGARRSSFSLRKNSGQAKRSKRWAKLTEIKNKIKRLHRVIPWLRLLDLVAERSSCVILGIGTVNVGSLLLSVDTRRSTVDRSRLFQHTRTHSDEQHPAEWTFSTRSVLFTPEGEESMEILDNAVLNIHGFLHKNIEGLRDASISLKLGRLHIPYDHILDSSLLAKKGIRKSDCDPTESASIEKTDPASSDQETEGNPLNLPKALTDANEFVASTLRGIRQISVAIGFFGLSKRVDFVQPTGIPLYVNTSMQEFGLDLYRLDPTTPAHSMYFARSEVAHQALISAISISVGIDDGHEHPDRILYIPMTTATIRTTLPAKILQFSSQKESFDLNSNIFFANLVMTSPSVDLDPQHLPLVLALIRNRPPSPSSVKQKTHHFTSQLLPKASIKLSVHEPVIRVSLPPVETKKEGNFEFDLLISAVSFVSMDIDASHTYTTEDHYNASFHFRIASHKLYYQTTSRQTHDLLVTDTIALKAQVTAAPELMVIASANFQTFSMYIVRPEISEGIRQIVHQLRTEVRTDKKFRTPERSQRPSPIRSIPTWLNQFELEASDFNVEVAGVDEALSSAPRGLTLHLDSWTSEYKANKDDVSRKHATRRRRTSLSGDTQEDYKNPLSPPPKSKQSTTADPSDGRRLTFHVRGLEAFVVESMALWEPEPCISMPRGEVAFTTSNDGNGSVLHVNSHIKSIYIQYSLFKHYAIGVATITLQNTLSRSPSSVPDQKPSDNGSADSPMHETLSEFVIFDSKLGFVQVKAEMPEDPHMMFQMENMQAGRHRWTTPFFRSQTMRLFVEHPTIPKSWCRVVSIKNPRLDIRDGRRKHLAGTTTPERTYDIVTEALRIGVPHQLIVHKIFDNFINTIKTSAQLHHRFKTRSNEYILQKYPEGAKKIPKISLRAHMVLFEIEEGAFEWKLGAIFRAGLVEQKQRLAREAAFDIKCQKIRNASSKHGSSTLRSASPMTKESSTETRTFGHRRQGSRASSRRQSSRSRSRSRVRNKDMRYNRDGTHDISSDAKTSIDDAWQRLQVFNAQSWRKRINRALNHHSGAVQDIRSLLWGYDSLSEAHENHERILKIPSRPALMAVLMSDLTLNIDKPSFPLSELPDFMYRVGKGLPKDTEFGLLIPLNAHFDVGELQISLRDYPLPLLHIPSIKPGQSPRLPSWSLKTDFVIAEEFRNFESTRDLSVMVIPPEKMHSPKKTGGFAVDVRRTVSPVKTYSEMQVDINTARDTRITWGTSYQPAIQDLMQVIEGFTKPQADPSDKVGFWDKIRLSFHSRINVSWNGGGDVHLMLKGSRDPYVVTGYGAGFVMVWRNNVRWNIWQEDDPTKFMTVNSGDYVLAIPDFSHYARRSPEFLPDQAINNDKPGQDTVQKFRKVIMKLSGNVRWQAGLVFERNLRDGGRSFDFKPHYDITLKNPAHIKEIKDDATYDAFRGFRSHHIHMSIAVASPSDREWSVTNTSPSSNYNAVHLSPRFFTHFFNWWGLFSGPMSLPIRQGTLFPNIEKTGKKFGRHIATIKYQLLLSPLFVSHVYIHKDADEFNEDVMSATGLKMRLDSFMFDVHQRKEEFQSEVKGQRKTVTTTGMRINQALVDLIGADMRAVSVRIAGTTMESVNRHAANQGGQSSQKLAADLDSFTIPDNDYSWIDVDDFVEVDWNLPADQNPKTWILPLAYAPRFTYRRQTDHAKNISGDANRRSVFGYENTHSCVMSSRNDSRQVQINLIAKRIEKIEELVESHNRNIGEHELQLIREAGDKTELKRQLAEMTEHGESLAKKKVFLGKMLKDLQKRLKEGELKSSSLQEEPEQYSQKPDQSSDNDDAHTNAESEDHRENSMDASDHVGDFNNRFVVHNAQIKWNNSLRNTILRYIHQVSQRRGFVYYTSRRAVKFILDIIEEQTKSKSQMMSDPTEPQEDEEPDTPWSNDGELSIRDRVQQLMDDGKKFVNADDPEGANGNRKPTAARDANEDIAHDFVPQNTYHVRLVAPQIQLQSDKNPKAVVLVTTRGMRLRVYQIMDKDRMSDEVSGLVQTRYSLEMDNMQFFVTTKQLLSPRYIQIYSGNHYGTPSGSFWPPWAPIEAMFDFGINNYGFARVVQRTSASVRYDKYNKLRLKYNDSVSEGKDQGTEDYDNPESRMDHLWVDFPHLRAICDSTQYYSMYIIVLDLLMWSEPLEKTRNERLEKIMLASDFSDLRGAPEMVIMLQDRIRQLDEIKTHFHVNEKYLDQEGWNDRIQLEKDLVSCEDELFFIMKAITTAQRRMDERVGGASQVNGVLRYFISASEIVWHLTKEADQPLAEFQLEKATFERKDNSDGSNLNVVEIDRIQGLSLLPNAMYPQIIQAYTEHLSKDSLEGSSRMLRVNWYKLEAIAGIHVVDHFEVNLHPLQVQLEYETGRKLFEYIFPGAGNGEEGFSPLMIKHNLGSGEEEENDDEQEQSASKAKKESLNHVSNNLTAGNATGAGSLENRLQPTHELPDYRQSAKGKPHGLGISKPDALKSFTFHRTSSTTTEAVQKKPRPGTSLDEGTTPRGRFTTRIGSTASATEGSDKKTRFNIQKISTRSASVDSRKSKESRKTNEKSDDLTQMMNRASNYMTLAYVKIPSMVLCLSYKGKGNRNFEDVHHLVFRMPTIEYRNKTWSNLDLALALKKDVIKALLHHTGAIIGNKFHHKPGKYQQSRLRELANSSIMLSSAEVSRIHSPASSDRDLTRGKNSEDTQDTTELARTTSIGSGLSGMSDTPEIEVWSPTGEIRQPEWSSSADQQSVGRGSLRRQLTAAISQRSRKGSEDRPEDKDETQPDETSPKRPQFVKKILQSLDRN